MGSHGSGIDHQSTTDTIPEDVAALYSWANLRGAKYRDYSASRREHRAEVRYRAAKALLERELKAQAEAEASAEAAEREAHEAESRALASGTSEPKQSRLAALRLAEEAALKAAADRVEAARRAEAAAHATVIALREERELVEAKASATQQERIYTQSEAMRKELAGPQPYMRIGDAAGVPEISIASIAASVRETDQLEAAAPSEPEHESAPASKVSSWQPLSEAILGPDEHWHLATGSGDELGGKHDTAEQATPAWLTVPSSAAATDAAIELQPTQSATPGDSTLEELRIPQSETPDEPAVDAEVTNATAPDVTAGTPAISELPHWARIPQVVESPGRELLATPVPPQQIRTPLLAVFSLTGGVGATSLLASLGRALSAAGEKVILIDTTSQALLPFYFGGRELRPGLMRTYSPPDAGGEPISLILHDATQMNGDDDAQQRLAQQIFAGAFGTDRILADVSPAAIWLLRRWARLKPAVLVPLIPSMDAMLRLESTERLFRELSTPPAEPLLPYYVLNHFDRQQPLHEQLRTALRRRLGDRLLHVAVAESATVAQAVADGLTVIDYAPDSEAAQEYRDLAAWLRIVSPPRAATAANTRWGEP